MYLCWVCNAYIYLVPIYRDPYCQKIYSEYGYANCLSLYLVSKPECPNLCFASVSALTLLWAWLYWVSLPMLDAHIPNVPTYSWCLYPKCLYAGYIYCDYGRTFVSMVSVVLLSVFILTVCALCLVSIYRVSIPMLGVYILSAVI